jgi:hypothetical protein
VTYDDGPFPTACCEGPRDVSISVFIYRNNAVKSGVVFCSGGGCSVLLCGP